MTEEPHGPETAPDPPRFSPRQRQAFEILLWVLSPAFLLVAAVIVAAILGAPMLRASLVFAFLALGAGAFLLYRPQSRLPIGRLRSAGLVFAGLGAVVLALATMLPSAPPQRDRQEVRQIGRWCYQMEEDGSVNLDITLFRREDGTVVSRELPKAPGAPDLIPMAHRRLGEIDEFSPPNGPVRYRVTADGRLNVHRPSDGVNVASLEPMRSLTCAHSSGFGSELEQAAARPASAPPAPAPPAQRSNPNARFTPDPAMLNMRGYNGLTRSSRTRIAADMALRLRQAGAGRANAADLRNCLDEVSDMREIAHESVATLSAMCAVQMQWVR